MLSRFPNLKIISRDRGVQYKNLSNKYIHIADRFHLITNLSDMIIERIKNTVPRMIKLPYSRVEVDSVSIALLNEVSDPIVKEQSMPTLRQKEKINLIMEIKEHFTAGIAIRQLAKHYGMSKNTIKKYIAIQDAEFFVMNRERRNDTHFLDTIKPCVISLCNECYTIKEITESLQMEYGEQISYGKIARYLSKHNLKPIQKIIDTPPKRAKLDSTDLIILRSKIIKYIFDWKLLEDQKELIDNNIKQLLDLYPLINLFKEFYRDFKFNLLNMKYDKLMEMLENNYDDITINKFIKSLCTDYEAVIHASQYTYSNGVTEGNVNKLKKIKRDMYNKASIELLRNKVIYQSLYF